MKRKKTYRIGTEVWVELEIDTRYYGNVMFLIRDNEGREEGLYLGRKKAMEIKRQLDEWMTASFL